MSVLRSVFTLGTFGLVVLAFAANSAREAAAQPPMNPQMQMMNPQMMNPQMMNPQMMNPQMMNAQMMNPQMGAQMAGYYQPDMGGQMQPGGYEDGGDDGGDGGGGGPCPYCGGQGCPHCGGGHGHEPLPPMDNQYVGSFIESAIPITQVRVRYDRGINFQDFDRALYYFPTTVANGGQLPSPETVLDREEITTSLEVAITDRFSMFVDLPGVLVDSDSGPPANGGQYRDGFGDIRAGGKVALLACENRYLTAVGRLYLPTGDAEQGLGTGHMSAEAGLLYWRRFWERFTFEAEILDWVATYTPTIPGNGHFGGNVLQYGLGFGYDIIDNCSEKCSTRVSAVGEFVGWTVLNGKESDPTTQGVTNASGETIINCFGGVRATVGQHSFYIGYGRKLSDEFWYKEDFRLEYAWRY